MNAKALVIGIFPIFLSLSSNACHLRAVDISVEQIDCEGFTFRISVSAYLDLSCNIAFGGPEDWLDFGDGQGIAPPEIPTTPRPDLGPQIGFASFSLVHTYTRAGLYHLNYSEGNRNEIINVDNSTANRLSVSAELFVDPLGCNSLPIMTIPPVDRACSGVLFSYTPGAYDADGDSLSYQLIVPKSDGDTPAQNYRYPDNPQFYSNHSAGNENMDGPATFIIDSATGLITWDAPDVQGEYAIAFRVTEWRWNPLLNVYQKISSLTRDMQIIVADCDNNRPVLVIPTDTCVVAGAALAKSITASDVEGHPVKIETWSEVYNLPVTESPASFTPEIPDFRPSVPADTMKFLWETTCSHVRDQPYRITFKVTDDPPSGPPLSTYKVWSVKVVAAAPEWDGIEVDFIRRHAAIRWKPYTCEAEKIQIWRKVATGNFTPALCDAGLPRYLGYELVGEVDGADQYFLDTNNDDGLAVGAAYCYRLLAVLPGISNTSIVSEEICLDPIQIDAPVITHATVEETAIKDGSVRISWRSPFEINRSQFPGPYEYVVYRGTGFSNGDPVQVSNRLRDTTFVDNGLNTEDSAYHYFVVLHSNTINDPNYYPIDTSATASTVRLTTTPGAESIRLDWQATVPWSNVAPENKRHLIYRGVHGEPMVLIDSIDVSSTGFSYIDRGRFQSIPIDPNTYYCYHVVTRGTYGNPAIDLLENASQVSCSYPVNDLRPCAPAITLNVLDCDEFIREANCDQNSFTNSLTWNQPAEEGCRLDVVAYRVLAADDPAGEFELIADNIHTTSYTDADLVQPARCYRVVAVDKLGRTNEPGDPVCQDNCPYFELPNVFTPNDDGCNDVFRPYVRTDEELEPACPSTGSNRCPRFVSNLSIRIYNRWGIEVYQYQSRDESVDSFMWNGKDTQGVLLQPAVYYYVADVTFDAISPSRRKSKIKGWVHLIY